MEFFYLALFSFLLYVFYRNIITKLNEFNTRVTHLKLEIQWLRKLLEEQKGKSEVAEPKPLVAEKPVEVPKPVEIKKEEPAYKTEEKISSFIEPVKEEIKPEKTPIPEPVESFKIKKSWFESFKENNPDLEKFIGENLINKIGIAILVIGIGFFVKYAIDQNWINEIGRVAIGIFAGSLLIGLAHRLRNTFNAFSSVLVGGGLAVFYFTIAIAYHEYNIFSQSVAFAIMVVITLFSVLLSLGYNRVELAVIAIVGGFASPFFVSSGEGNYVVLFTYILILNIGMLILAYYKKWNLINILAFFFTSLLYGGWISTIYDTENVPLAGGLAFGTAFYLIFFAMNIINNIRYRAQFNSWDIGLLMADSSFYYACGMLLLSTFEKGLYQGVFTIALAIFNFIFAFVLLRNKRVDINLVYLLIGLILTFISLVAPVQLKGNNITLFWAIESVMLLWFSQKSGLKLVKISSFLVLFLMVFSLMMDWQNLYGYIPVGETMPVIINKAFITGFVSIICIAAFIYLLHKEPESDLVLPGDVSVPFSYLKTGLLYVAGAMFYFFLLFELYYQLQVYVENNYTREIILGVYHYTFASTLYFVLPKSTLFRYALMGIYAWLILFILSVYEPDTYSYVTNLFYRYNIDFGGYFLHFVLIALFIFILSRAYLFVQTAEEIPGKLKSISTWVLCVIILYVASMELMMAGLALNIPDDLNADFYTSYDNISSETTGAGFSILWAICAFAFIFLGLKRKRKNLRIIALILFGIILLKLFFFDLSDISEGGKIIAFIILGIILLVISFLYQKIKKLIIEDEPQTDF